MVTIIFLPVILFEHKIEMLEYTLCADLLTVRVIEDYWCKDLMEGWLTSVGVTERLRVCFEQTFE